MCGFVGIVGEDVDATLASAALDAMSHRGPDGRGLLVDESSQPPLTLGHCRLAIIDLSTDANQPMTSADGRFVLAFNGEIFNFREIARELQGVSLRTRSDTEVLLEFLARTGPAGLRHLNGMFALALFDKRTRRLLLARDHLGVKPLYYSIQGQRLLFASEVKALLRLGVEPRLDHERAGEYLAQGWVLEPHTAFQGIAKLPAGHYATFEGGKFSSEPFWDLPLPSLSRRPAADAAGELMDLVKNSVEAQLVSDRPVGVYLSGGVDSSLIASFASACSGELKAFTGRFDSADSAYEGVEDDGRWADRLAARLPSLEHHNIVLRSDAYDVYRDLVWFLDEPIADAGVVPAYLLAKCAREAGAIVLLSGMGGDEVFGGYRRYSILGSSVLQGLQWACGWGPFGWVAGQAERLSGGPERRLASHFSRFAAAGRDAWPLSYIPLIGHFDTREVDALVGPAWREPYLGKLGAVLSGWEGEPRVRQAQRIDMKGYLASHNLTCADKASMAASVEVRVPLLDHRLVEFAFRLPPWQIATATQQKPLLKQLCAQTVGREFAYRRKAGFTMPVRSWLRRDLRPELDRVLFKGPLAEVLNPDAVRSICSDHYDGRRENTWKLWTLLTLGLWLERFKVAVA